MLLRIEVFSPAGKAGSAPSDEGTPKPSQTLYVSPATVANRRKLANGGDDNDDETDDDDDATVDGDAENDADPNAGLVATIGRKGDAVDILFGADRSISRQHALLRFVAPLNPKNGKRSTRGRGKKAEDHPSDTGARGWCMEPRNETERSACETSPYGMCLVLENKGKSGSYIPSVDETVDKTPKDATTKQEEEEEEDSDATTDDEGGVAKGATTSTASSPNYAMATSLATQLGEVLVRQTDTGPSQSLPLLSGAVRAHFGPETPVKLTKLDVDESQVLALEEEDSGAVDRATKTGTDTGAASVLIQFGCAQLPTIRITRLPMTVVFSSGVPSPIQNSLGLCGGLLQESTFPRKDRDSNANTLTNTTHLVVPERMAVAKQLIAWCYGIPIVSPDFLLALRNHGALADPFPDASDFPAKATDTNAFWDWTPNPSLLSKYTMISVDPSPEVEQAEGLAEAAGATLERLYERTKKHTKAKVQACLKRAKDLREEAITQNKQLVLLASKAKSKCSNANTTLLLKQLKEELLIPPVSSKILAKTITKQESTLVGLEASNSSSSDKDKESSKDKNVNPVMPSETAREGEDHASAQDHGDSQPSPEWQLRKRARPKDRMEQKKPETNSNNDKGNTEAEEETPSQSRSGKRHKVNPQQEEWKPPSDNDKRVVARAKTRETSHTKNSSGNTTNQATRFGGADAHGWFTAAPKDDRERSRWRQRAAEAYQKETGMALEASASTSDEPRIHIDSAMSDTTNRPNRSQTTTSANRRQTNPNLPNFKQFRKNFVPMTDPGEEVVVLLDASLPNARQAPKELSAEELELRENERIAEALFKGDMVPGMGKKKRRVRG